MFKTQTPAAAPPPPFPSSSDLPAGKLPRTSSKTLALLARSFDDGLLRSLNAIGPPSLSLAWLSLALDLLPPTLADAQSLVFTLRLASLPKPLGDYLDHSVAVLDVCNSLFAEIERLRQRRLLLHFVLHLLHDPSPQDLARARDCLADYRTGKEEGRARLAEAASLIRNLVAKAGLASPPRGKCSTIDKLLRRIIYSVGAVTAFVAGTTVSVLAGSLDNPAAAAGVVPAEFLWAGPFNELHSAVAGKIRRRCANEEEALEAAVQAVCDVADGATATEKEKLGNAVRELAAATKAYSEGLDRVADGVNKFFRAVMGTRNSLLQSYRSEDKNG